MGIPRDSHWLNANARRVAGTVWGRGFAPSRPSLGSAVPEFGSFKESGQLGAVEEPAFPVWRGHSCPRIDCVGTAALGCPAAQRRHKAAQSLP